MSILSKVRRWHVGAAAAALAVAGVVGGGLATTPASATGPTYYQASSVNNTLDGNDAYAVDCTSGDYATGGGFSYGGGTVSDLNYLNLIESVPDLDSSGNPIGWRVDANNTGSPDSMTLNVWAECVHPS